MIEIKSPTHIIRMLATKTYRADIFLPVNYHTYLGDISKVPFYYKKVAGHTCINDLTKSTDEILAGVRRDTKKRIKSAFKIGCKFEVFDDIYEYIKFHNEFCKSRGLDDYVSVSRIKKFKNVFFTKTTYNGFILAMHATLVDKESETAFMLFSATPREQDGIDKKMIGCGNRFLHFKEFEYFKNIGIKRYRWGAVTIDKDDPRHMIGDFKRSFGGELVDTWAMRTPVYRFLEIIRDKIVRLRK